MFSVVVLQHEERRVRVLLAYEPSEYALIEDSGIQEEVPIQYALHDIVIVRERRNQRPLNEDDNPDLLWKSFPEVNIMEAKIKGQEYRNLLDGSVSSQEIESPATVSSLLKGSKGSGLEHNNDDSKGMFQRLFPGGIIVQGDQVVTADSLSTFRVLWSPKAVSTEGEVLLGGLIQYSLQADLGTTPQGDVFIKPPVLNDLKADKFYFSS